MLKEQLAMQKRQMRAGGSDPYATDFSNVLAGQDIKNEEEIINDNPLGSSGKSFSF